MWGGLTKKELDRPLFPNRSNFFKYTFLITLGVIVTLALVVAFGEGDNFIERLGDSYKSTYNTTIYGTPWTHIMRDNQLYFIVPALAVLGYFGSRLGLGVANRAIVIYIVFGIGFVGGHVFW